MSGEEITYLKNPELLLLMKTYFLAVASVLLSATGPLIGGDSGSLLEISKLQAALQAVPGISATSSSTYEMGPAYYEINRVSPAEAPGHTITKRVLFSGAMFKIEQKFVSKRADLYADYDVAYNGKLMQKLDRVNGSLSIWNRYIPDMFDSRSSVMDQFGFLAGFVSKDSQSINLENLRSGEIWSKLIAKTKFVGPRVIDGKKVLRFQVDDAFDPMGNVACRYEIDLSPEHGNFPMRWAVYTTHGDCFLEFRVTEFGKASLGDVTYFYPVTAETRQIGWGKFAGKPVFSCSLKTDAFQVEKVDEKSFTLDPASARQIVDEETQTAIAVSR